MLTSLPHEKVKQLPEATYKGHGDGGKGGEAPYLPSTPLHTTHQLSLRQNPHPPPPISYYPAPSQPFLLLALSFTPTPPFPFLPLPPPQSSCRPPPPPPPPCPPPLTLSSSRRTPPPSPPPLVRHRVPSGRRPILSASYTKKIAISVFRE